MSGLMQSTFKNLRKHPKIIPISLLVVGAGGGGAGGGYYGYHGGYGGNAGYGAEVYNTSNVIGTNFTYTVTVAPYALYGQINWNGSSYTTIQGSTGGASHISGIFRVNAGLIAYGGAGGSGMGGGGGGAGISTYSITPFGYSSITGASYGYGGGSGGGTYRTYLGNATIGVGGNGAGPGQAGGGGSGAGNSFGYTGPGGRGGLGAAGVVIMRCRRDAYTNYTATGGLPTVTPLTIDSIEYSVFRWNNTTAATTTGSIIFT